MPNLYLLVGRDAVNVDGTMLHVSTLLMNYGVLKRNEHRAVMSFDKKGKHFVHGG